MRQCARHVVSCVDFHPPHWNGSWRRSTRDERRAGPRRGAPVYGTPEQVYGRRRVMEILSAEQTSQRLSYPALAQAIADVLRTPGARAVERVQMPLANDGTLL